MVVSLGFLGLSVLTAHILKFSLTIIIALLMNLVTWS